MTQPGTTRQSAVAAVRLHKVTYLDSVRLIALQSGGVCSDQESIIFGKDGRAIGGEKTAALSGDWAFAGRNWKLNKSDSHLHESRQGLQRHFV